MNPAAVLGAILAIAVGIAHSYLGERYILTRLFRRTDLPHLFGSDVFTRRTLRVAWHLTTLAWWGFAAVLLLLVRPSPVSSVGSAIAVTFGVTALTTFAGSRGRHLAWPVFAAIALAAWYSTRS